MCFSHTDKYSCKSQLSTGSSGLCHASLGAGLRKMELDAKLGHGSVLEEPGQVHSGLSVCGGEQHELGENMAFTEFLLCANVLN